MPADTKALVEKIEALPAERIAEIEDFVDFISQREQQRGLARAAAAASDPAFAAIWNNPEDDVYNAPFEFGTVVLVPFPFTTQTRSKRRPAVVVSNRAYNAARPSGHGDHQSIAPEPRSGRSVDRPLADSGAVKAVSGQAGLRHS